MDDRSVDLRRYLNALLRRWWLVLLGPIVAGLVGWYNLPDPSPPVYQATARILVQQSSGLFFGSLSDIQLSSQIAATSRELMLTRNVLEEVVQTVSFKTSVDAIRSAISITVPGNNRFLNVTARTGDPRHSEELANTLAAVFDRQTRDNRLAQIARLQAAAAAQGVELDPSTITAQLNSGTTFSVIDPARATVAPVSNDPLRSIAIAMALGLFVSLGAAFALDYLSDPIPAPDRLEEILGIATLGVVTEWEDDELEDGKLLLSTLTDSIHAEQYRGLGANLAFAAAPSDAKVFLVTSAMPNEGKTSTSANLALALAERGEEVALVDADLRKPQITNLLAPGAEDASNVGLTRFLSERTQVAEEHTVSTINLAGYRYRPGLRIVPSGPLPPNPTSLLSSDRMDTLMQSLRSTYSVVIVDSPPVLAVADTAAIAPHVDGVVFVVDVRRTRMGQLRASLRAIQRTGVPVLGLVFNKIHLGRMSYSEYYGYRYYYGEYYSSNGATANSSQSWYQWPAAKARSVRDRLLRRG